MADYTNISDAIGMEVTALVDTVGFDVMPESGNAQEAIKKTADYSFVQAYNGALLGTIIGYKVAPSGILWFQVDGTSVAVVYQQPGSSPNVEWWQYAPEKYQLNDGSFLEANTSNNSQAGNLVEDKKGNTSPNGSPDGNPNGSPFGFGTGGMFGGGFGSIIGIAILILLVIMLKKSNDEK